MAETAKIPKAAVLYIHIPGTNYKCKDCLFGKQNANKCAYYGPMVSIKPWGSCGLFVYTKSHPEMPWIPGKYNKENTGYVENREGFSCLRCEYFDGANKDCQKVDKYSPGDDPGQITAEACCNAWEKNDEK